MKKVVADMMQPNGSVFLRSEWEPISDSWPAVSFTNEADGTYFKEKFYPGRDVLILVGTSKLKNANYRRRLLSALVPEPNCPYKTDELIPPASWYDSLKKYGNRFSHSLAVQEAANIVGHPDARKHVKTAYASKRTNRGPFVEAEGVEREAVMALEVLPVTLNLPPDVQKKLNTWKPVNDDVSRMANLINNRVTRGGECELRINPIRTAPNDFELHQLILRLWQDKQTGKCPLCGAPVVAGTKNKMMRPSPDRIDSANPAYDEANVQIIHLACNLAKNDNSLEDFAEWIAALRGAGLISEP